MHLQNISHACFFVLNHLAFDIVNFLLHHGNGPYSFTCVLYQFWRLYFCCNIKCQFLIYQCSRQVMCTSLGFGHLLLSRFCNNWFLWIEVLQMIVQILSWFYFRFHFYFNKFICCMFTPSHPWLANRKGGLLKPK